MTVIPYATAIGRWAAGLRPSDVPQPVLHESKRLILDSIGVSVAALHDEVATGFSRASTTFGTGDTTAIACGHGVPAASAALVNGTLMHALDYDDMLFGGHMSACVLPAVLAAAQTRRAVGPEILAAYTAGAEVFGQLARSVPSADYSVPRHMHRYGFHPTSVYGLIGATVGAARALGLDAAGAANALAVATSSGCGVTQNFGSMVKPLHAGYAASGGVRAAQLAQAGFYGDPYALEGDYGYSTAYFQGAADWAALVDRLGSPFRMEEHGPSIKQYPCCGGNHVAITNALSLVARHGVQPVDVAKVVVHINPEIMPVLRFGWPETSHQARFSPSFSVAAAVAAGSPGLRTFEEGFHDPSIIEMGKRTVVEPDFVGSRIGARVELQLVDGRTVVEGGSELKGTPSDPLTDDEVIAKFHDCCDGLMGRQSAERIVDAVFHLDDPAADFWPGWGMLASIEGWQR